RALLGRQRAKELLAFFGAQDRERATFGSGWGESADASKIRHSHHDSVGASGRKARRGEVPFGVVSRREAASVSEIVRKGSHRVGRPRFDSCRSPDKVSRERGGRWREDRAPSIRA